MRNLFNLLVVSIWIPGSSPKIMFSGQSFLLEQEKLVMGLDFLFQSNHNDFFAANFIIKFPFFSLFRISIWIKYLFLIENNELIEKGDVRLGSIPSLSDKLEGSIGIPLILQHEICANYGCRSWYSGMTVHKHVHSFWSGLIDKLLGLSEIDGDGKIDGVSDGEDFVSWNARQSSRNYFKNTTYLARPCRSAPT